MNKLQRILLIIFAVFVLFSGSSHLFFAAIVLFFALSPVNWFTKTQRKQEIGLDQYSGQEKAPYSLMLSLDDTELQLEVIWVKDPDPETFVVHTFRRESSPYRMIKQLLDANIGDHVSVEYYATESVAKIFDRIKLNSIVEKLFFRTVDQYSVSPINQRPVLKDLSQNELDEVNAYIKSLESIEGGWYRNRLCYAQGDSL